MKRYPDDPRFENPKKADEYYYKFPYWLFDRHDVSPAARMLYVRMRWYFSDEVNAAYPSQERLAEDMGGVSVKSIQNYIRELRDAGLIVVVRVGLQRSNHYRFPAQAEADTTAGPYRPELVPDEDASDPNVGSPLTRNNVRVPIHQRSRSTEVEVTPPALRADGLGAAPQVHDPSEVHTRLSAKRDERKRKRSKGGGFRSATPDSAFSGDDVDEVAGDPGFSAPERKRSSAPRRRPADVARWRQGHLGDYAVEQVREAFPHALGAGDVKRWTGTFRDLLLINECTPGEIKRAIDTFCASAVPDDVDPFAAFRRRLTKLVADARKVEDHGGDDAVRLGVYADDDDQPQGKPSWDYSDDL